MAEPKTLADHVAAVHAARSAHMDALANPGQTVDIPKEQGGGSIPLALVTSKRLDDARSAAMAQIHGPQGAGSAYAAAQRAAADNPTDENRAAEQRLALELQQARQAVRSAHGQAGHSVAGDAVRS